MAVQEQVMHYSYALDQKRSRNQSRNRVNFSVNFMVLYQPSIMINHSPPLNLVGRHCYMIIISWNVQGISELDKQALNKKEITENNPTIVILQETKTTIFDIPLIQSLWSFRNVG